MREAWDNLRFGNPPIISSDKWKIYFDMDGVLARFNKNATMEEVFSEGYFRTLPPIQGMVDFAKDLHFRGFEVFILSKSCYSAIQEKIDWLSEFTPFIIPDKFVFVPLNANKANFVNIDERSILIDDYNPNLRDWSGFAIKCITDINNPHLDFNSVYARKMPVENFRSLNAYINEFEKQLNDRTDDFELDNDER